MVETKDYIDRIDQGLEDSVGKYMCTSTCRCVELDVSKWDTSMAYELSRTDSSYIINDPDGYTSFE